jgi:enoyl-CoA hydratase/3-hydroxyacyl-CoA dehydrogenase
MGHGIAEALALAGRAVCVTDVEQRFLNNAKQKIEWSVTKLQERGKLQEGIDSVMGRLSFKLDLADAVQGCDMVIEAVPEDLELKERIFADLDYATGSSTVLATNTSCLPIREIAASVSDPSRVLGIHFFNPPVIMKLVEVIQGPSTSPETVRKALDLVQTMQKKPILVKRDVPGFVVNRVLNRMFAAARLVVQKGMAGVEEVDASLKYTAGLPMGAFELLDYIGLDTHYLVERALEERGFPMPPGDLIAAKVKAGAYGVKNGRGFYTYSKEEPRAVIPKELAKVIPASVILSPAVNEATWLVSEKIASKEDIDLSTKLGLSFPKGILALGDELGLDVVFENLLRLKESTGEKWLEPVPALREMVLRGELGMKAGKGFFQYART